MAIQHRHGEFKDFDPNKMVAAELAVVTSGDPASPTGRTLYICFAPGVVKRIVSYEDFENELQNATEEIQKAFTKEIRTAISNSIAATNAANEAKEAADLAAEAARKAAEAAGAYVLGDISEKTVKFTEAEGRENINTGESTATMFGKIKKWFADLKNIAFTGNYSDLLNVPEIVNNRTTTKEGTVLDGRQGKAIQDEFDKLNTKMNASGLNDRLLKNHEIGRTLTFNELLSKETVTFFTNWTDGVNFPGIYGSGIMIPGLDTTWKYIIYLGNGAASFGLWRSGSGIKWTKLT